MKWKIMMFVTVMAGCSSLLQAGGVFEMSAKKADGTAAVVEKIYAQDGNLRVDDIEPSGEMNRSVIFQSNQVILINHAEKKFSRIDEATLAKMSEQMQKASAAMEQMKQQLASMPPQQREMMEKMMKGRMGNMPGMGDAAPAVRVEADGTGTWKTSTCKQFALYVGDVKTRELCTVPPGQIEGSEELLAAAESMKAFFEKFKNAMHMPELEKMMQNPVEMMNKTEGFPVVTQEFVGGKLKEERFLSSAKKEGVSASQFSTPTGYKEEKLMR